MGACSVSLTLEGKATWAQVKAAFEARKACDLQDFGNDPYNGSFTTIEAVKLVDRTFDTLEEALDFCLDGAQKWDVAVATHFKQDDALCTLVAGWAAE